MTVPSSRLVPQEREALKFSLSREFDVKRAETDSLSVMRRARIAEAFIEKAASTLARNDHAR